jgi:uncharacterized membrane protein
LCSFTPHSSARVKNTLYGALALAIGVARGWRAVRVGALGLLCLAALKVFAFDLGYLDSASRIFSWSG